MFFVPRVPFPYNDTANYLVRAKPGERERLMRTVEEHLALTNPSRVIDWVRPLEYFKARSYQLDRNMSIFSGGGHRAAARSRQPYDLKGQAVRDVRHCPRPCPVSRRGHASSAAKRE